MNTTNKASKQENASLRAEYTSKYSYGSTDSPSTHRLMQQSKEHMDLTKSNNKDNSDITTEINSCLNENSNSKHGKQYSSLSKRRKRLLLVVMGIMDMFGGMLFSMIGPFFPPTAIEKNATPVMSGVVMAAFQFTMIFVSPLMGLLIPRVGVRVTYTTGVAVTGISSVIFGLLIYCPDNWFIPLSIIVRVVQGAGDAAFITSSYALLITLFTEDMATIFGMLETLKGVGYMIGPVFGSLLFDLGGYVTPFAVMGSITFTLGLAISSIIPKHTETMPSKLSMRKLFFIPMELVCALMHAALAYMFSNFDATFALHAEQFDMKQIYVGLYFFALAVGYCSTTPIMGKITDKWPNYAYIFLLVGFTLCAFSILLVGPAPFLPLPSNNQVLLAVSLVTTGIFASTSVVTFTIMFSAARLYDFPDNIDTYGKISGFVEGFYNVGAFIGPIAGGLVYQNYGWEWSFTICAFLFFACLILLVIVLLWQKFAKGMPITAGLAPKPQEEVVNVEGKAEDTMACHINEDADSKIVVKL